MRILIINYEYPPVGAGAGNASKYLADTLVEEGHSVSVITSAFNELPKVRDENGVCVHRIPAFRRYADRSSIFQMMCFTLSGLMFGPHIAKKDKIQQVIVFFTIPSGICGYWLRLRLGLPYIVSLRGGDVPGFDPSLNRIHQWIRPLRRRILREAHTIAANSRSLADRAEKADHFPVKVIPNGVDGDTFKPKIKPRQNQEQILRVVFVGRLQEQKNLSLLIQQMSQIKKIAGQLEGSFEFHVVGDGPLRAELQEYARSLEVDKAIVWHGWLRKPELLAIYQNVDCYVSPSLFEGMSNSILEAMACGLPVVAARIPGNDELIVHEKTGILFDLKQPDQLGLVLKKLKQNPELVRTMGNAARQRALNSFSWEKSTQAYLGL